MNEPLVLVSIDEGILTITINRPQKLNAFSTDLLAALRDALDGSRDTANVVIITGAGDRAFCAGADINQMRILDARSAPRFIRLIHETCWAAHSHPQPIIAAINGFCLGAGLEFAMSCDFRIAADNAVLGMPEIRLGIPSVIEAALMPDLIGSAWTNEMLLTGDNIDARQAARIGLVTRVVAHDRLQDGALALAKQLAAYSPIALRLQKSLISAWRDNTLSKAVDLGVQAFAESFISDHPSEGMAAFLEKRHPQYR